MKYWASEKQRILYTNVERRCIGGGMFGRRKKKEPSGQTCPLCQLVNSEEAPACTRCYYEFTVAAHRQTVSEITDEESDGLFGALMEDDEEFDEQSPLVDWTNHKFTMDDMTVEVSPYDEDGIVEVDQSVSMDHQFDAPQQTARVKGEKMELPDEYTLTAEDAPKNVTKFDTGDGPDLTYTEEEYSTPVVNLVEMTESEDIEPVSSTSAVPDDADNSLNQNTALESPKQIPTVPEIPNMPQSLSEISPEAEIPTVPQVPQIPMIASVPETPQTTTPPSSFSPTSESIWPWPQLDQWDDITVRKSLREAMELAKSGDIESSKQIVTSLGPHLGERVDLIFHISVLLKRFEQEDVMRRMIQSAQSKYPDSTDVAKAAENLLA